MQQSPHILTQMGVLSSFSVAKKVTEDDISKFFKKHKKLGKTEDEIGELLKQKIYEEIRDALVNHKIPGLLTPMEVITPNVESKLNENMTDLNRFIMVIAHKLIEKKYDKYSLCYFINSLVNMLGLSERDFERFHKRMQSKDDERTDDDDENEE